MEKFNLTFPEENIWLVENFYNLQKINIISGSLIINKDFDFELAEKTVNKYVELNDGMRIRVTIEDSIPMQYIADFKEFKADRVSVIGKTEEEIDKIKDEYISSEFDLIDKPLFSYLLIDRGNGKGEIFLKAHHMICDGWSGSKMVMDLAAIYDIILENDNNFEKYPSYIDYIKKEEEYKNSEKYIKDEEYWKEYLKGFTETVSIKNTNIENTEAKRYSVKLDEKLNKIILDYCKENRISPYTVFMTALAVYLERTTEKNDLVIGTPVLNRGNFAEKKMQGMFVSTMPVRFVIDESKTFKELCLENVKDTMNSFRHQRFPYSKTVENARKINGTNDNLYKIMLSYQNARAKFDKENSYRMSWNFSKNIQSELEIHIIDLNDDGILEIDYDYNTLLFEEIEIEYISKRIETIIYDGIVNNKTVETIEIMPEEEKNKILYDFNDTKRDYPTNDSIIDIFKKQVKENLSKDAIIYNNERYSYEYIDKLSSKLANKLKNDVKKGDVIAIELDRSEKVLIAIIAALKLGAAYIPVDINLPKDRKEYMIKNANTVKIIDINCFENLENEKEFDSKIRIDLTDPFYILYTSGSTGKPKGAAISHKNMLNFYYHFKHNNEFKNINKIISITTISFDIFVFEAIIPLLFGKTVIMTDDEQQKNPLMIKDLIQKYKIQMMQATPSRMQLILSSIGNLNELVSLKKIVLAGESIPEDLKAIIVNSNKKLCNGYGPTETTIFSSYTDITKMKYVTIGRPFSNTKFWVRDKKYRLLPFGVSGELYISGDGVSLGYINNEKLNKESFLIINDDIEYKTGDFVKINFDYQTICEGRKDSQIKIHGLRIELNEINNKIKNIKGIKDVYSLVYELSNYDKRIVSFVIAEIPKSSDEIKNIIKKSLPIYMIPRDILVIDKFFYTSNGKIDKNKFIELYDNKINFKKEDSYNINSEEKDIINIVKQVCGKQVTPLDSFWSSGLDSFDIIRLSVALSNKYNKDILVKDIIESDNVKDLTKIILLKPNKHITQKQKVVNKVRLSKNQESIFYNYIKDTNSLVYNTPCEIKLKKDESFSIDDLTNALEKIFNYHEAFKSNIIIDDGIPYLIYNKDKKINIEVLKCKNKDYNQIKNNFVLPFDLLKDNLVRVKIVDSNNFCYILFDSHHVIFDGFSIEIILNELYSLLKSNTSIRGRDGYFNYLNSKSLVNNKDDLNYYINKVSDKTPTKIEYYYKYNNESKNLGNRITYTINEKFKNVLEDYSLKNKITLNSIFLSALKILLSKYTYEEDIMIGVANSSRNINNSNLVGMFVNTLPYTSTINIDEKSLDFIKKTNNEVTEILNHCDCTSEEIIKSLNGKLSKLFSIAYAYQSFNGFEIKLKDQKSDIKYIYKQTSKFDMTFEIIPKKDRINLVLEFDSNLYNYDTANNILNNYKKCIKQLITKDNINEIDIIDLKEKKKVLEINNVINNEIDYSIQQIFTEVVNKNKSKNAIVHNDKTITYEELNDYSNAIAFELIKNGVKKGDIVPIIMDKSIDLIVGIIAIIKTGAAYLPLDNNIPIDRLEYMINNSNSKTLLTKKGIVSGKILSLLKNIIYIESVLLNKENTKEVAINSSCKDNLYVMYTSGSTGLPKGVIIRQEGIIRLVKDNNYIEIKNDDIVALSGTISFDASVYEMWTSILNGLTLHIIDKELLLQQNEFEKYIKNNNITIMLLTTALFNNFAQFKPEMFNKVRYLLTGGDVFSYKSGNTIINNNKNIKLINAYGPTEDSVIATIYNYTNEMNEDVPIGTPINNTSCYVTDIYGKLTPLGGTGELLIGGAGVTSGYINNDIETDKHLIYTEFEKNKLYKTGDLVKINDNSLLVFKRRKDNQIKLNGYRIEINEIINLLLEIKGIKEAQVILDDNKNILAYVVCNDELTVKDIVDTLKGKVPYYMMPKSIIKLKEMPLTIHGKVDNNKLLSIKIKENSKKLKPRNKKEETISNIWKKILNIDEIGIDDNFFELGGDSINVTQFIMEANSIGFQYVYSDLYNYPTIRELIEKQKDKVDKQYDMKDFNYKKLNYNIKKYSQRDYNKIKNVLITGTTGFLGAHVLSEYIDNYDGTAYCIIRQKDISSKERLKKSLRYFFGKKYDKYIDNRIKIITGDLTFENLGLNQDEYKFLGENVDAIINCAAYVKHFGNFDKFKRVNADSVSNLISFCLKYDKEIYHISTLSVCGNILEGGQVYQEIQKTKIFKENDLYFGQKLNNAYVYSKYLAEIRIIDKLSEGLKATIIRTGNLTGRYSDGKFQPNVEENAFTNRIKAFSYMSCIPNKLLDFKVEFTPIDYAANAICKMIFSDSNKLLITHLYNDNYVKMTDVIKILDINNIKIDLLDDELFSKKINEYINKKDKNIEGIVIDINTDNTINYDSKIFVNCNKTKDYLKTLGYDWPIIGDEYLYKYFNYLIEIGFLINGRNK